MVEKRRETLSFQDPETTFEDAFKDAGTTQPIPASSFCVLLFFGDMVKPSLSSSSELLLGTGETPCLVLSLASNFPVPMNSMTAFPNEWDSEVGGVLTMLLEPAVVEATADEIEDDDEEVEGDFTIWDGTAIIPFAAKTFCVFPGGGSL